MPPPPILPHKTVLLVQKTIPIFRSNSHNVAIALYKHLFSTNPTVKSLFSFDFLTPSKFTPKSQISAQAQILSDTILSFCASLPDLSLFVPQINRICHKHVAHHVKPDHYKAVANSFVAAAAQILADKLTQEEMQAWRDAILALAQLLIDHEKQIYEKLDATPGSWLGFRDFHVQTMVSNDNMPTTVTLRPADGCPVADYMSGQYVCLRAFSRIHGPVLRNLSLSPRMSADSGNSKLNNYTLSIPPMQPTIEGVVNADSIVYHHLKDGAVVALSAPVGGYVNGTKGTFMRRATRAREVGLGRLAALRGARSPLAEVVPNHRPSVVSEGTAADAKKPSTRRGANE